MVAQVYDDPLDTVRSGDAAPLQRLGLDAQYQYLLDPHAVTAQLVSCSNITATRTSSRTRRAASSTPTATRCANTNATDTTKCCERRLTYVYQAKYGGSLALLQPDRHHQHAYQTRATTPGTITSTRTSRDHVGDGNLTGNPATRGCTSKSSGRRSSTCASARSTPPTTSSTAPRRTTTASGATRSDNNSLFLYVWVAY